MKIFILILLTAFAIVMIATAVSPLIVIGGFALMAAIYFWADLFNFETPKFLTLPQ